MSRTPQPLLWHTLGMPHGCHGFKAAFLVARSKGFVWHTPPKLGDAALRDHIRAQMTFAGRLCERNSLGDLCSSDYAGPQLAFVAVTDNGHGRAALDYNRGNLGRQYHLWSGPRTLVYHDPRNRGSPGLGGSSPLKLC